MTASLAALPLIATPAHYTAAGWSCAPCGRVAIQPLTASERSAVEYTCDWHSIWPIPDCDRCGTPMAIDVVPVVRAAKRAEATTRLLTRTEIRTAKERAAALIKQLAETPERTLAPFGDYAGKPLEEVPGPELHRLRRYYTARKRGDLKRSKEIVRAIDAALAARQPKAGELHPALRDEADDGLPFGEEPPAARGRGSARGDAARVVGQPAPAHPDSSEAT